MYQVSSRTIKGCYEYVHTLQNALWELPFTNIYSTVTPDMLHQVKKGVWEHLINLVLEIVKRNDSSRGANAIIQELDLRIRLVPRYPGLKTFSRGISSTAHMTASEYFQTMRVCVHVHMSNRNLNSRTNALIF